MKQKPTEKKLQMPPWYDPMPRPPWYDPMPPWFRYLQLDPEKLQDIIGPGDPAPESLLDKEKIAQIKVAQLDMIIEQQEKSLNIVKLQRKLLKEQYNIK